jgi:hypothetical protein
VTSNAAAVAAGPACGSAEINGDGDLGTDADIEASFRVLAGRTADHVIGRGGWPGWGRRFSLRLPRLDATLIT